MCFSPTIVRVVCITSKRLMCHYKIFACLLAAVLMVWPVSPSKRFAVTIVSDALSVSDTRCLLRGCFRLLFMDRFSFPSR